MSKTRNSKNRSLVIDIIKKAEQPMSAENIFNSINSIKKVNLSTIYRILNSLTNQNVVIKQLKQDGIHYYEINDNTHKHNLICDRCHKTIKIENCPLKEFENSIKQKINFDITSHIIEFHGICKNCQK